MLITVSKYLSVKIKGSEFWIAFTAIQFSLELKNKILIYITGEHCKIRSTKFFFERNKENNIDKNKKASYEKIFYMVLYGQTIALIFVIADNPKYNISNAVG